MQNRVLVGVLAALLMISAMSLVTSQHRARDLFAEIGRASCRERV